MKVTGIIIAIVGAMLLGLGAALFVRQGRFQQGAQGAQAVVTENKLYTYTGNVNEYGVQHYYCSEFEFRTQDGRSVAFEEPNCAQLDQPPDYKVGEKVGVYYDPADPENTVQLGKADYSAVWAATIAGALALLLGLGLFAAGLLRGRRA